MNLANILNTDLQHIHITFTIPGTLSKILMQRGYKRQLMVKAASVLYQREMCKKAGVTESDWSMGIMATLHKSGNGLNYNPHVHMVATRDLINSKTGESVQVPFLPYSSMRIKWMKTFLRHLVILKLITKQEASKLRNSYKTGFHLYFQPIDSTNTDVIFRTAEYLASGFFHNSQIIGVNHETKEIIFKYQARVDRKTREKQYKTKKMSIFEFMAKMLYFLPDHHQKNIKYYGIYAKGLKEKLLRVHKATWATAVRHCFEKDPEECPVCEEKMQKFVTYSHNSLNIYRHITHSHNLVNGYFIRSPDT